MTDDDAGFGRRIRAAVTLGLVRVAEAEGLSGDELLASAGLTRADLQNPDQALPIERHVAVGRAMTERLGAVNAGLRSGAAIYGDPRGVLGYSLRRSGTHDRALARFCRFIAITNDSVRLSCVAHHDGLDLRAEMVSELAALGHPTEALFSAWVAIARTITGAHWAPLHVSFPHRAHGSADEHRQFFACPVEFGASIARMSLGHDALALAISAHAHPLEPVLVRLCAGLERHPTWNEAQGELLWAALERGGLEPDDLRVGPLRDAAAALLLEEGHPALEVAYLLGYQSVESAERQRISVA